MSIKQLTSFTDCSFGVIASHQYGIDARRLAEKQNWGEGDEKLPLQFCLFQVYTV